MKNDFCSLTKIELLSLYGINKFKHSKSRTARRRYITVCSATVLAAAAMIFYVCGLCYGLSLLGMGSIIPSYIAFICSLLVFAFGLFRAGAFVFSSAGYDVLGALPLRRGSIALSRFAVMYIEDLLVCTLVLVPAAVIYTAMCSPAWYFYPLCLVGLVFLPLLPLSLALSVGAAIAAAFKRIKHKSVIFASGTLLFVVAVLLTSYFAAASSTLITPDALSSLAAKISGIIAAVYPPAYMLGNALLDSPLYILAFIGISLLIGATILGVVCVKFDTLVRLINTTSSSKKSAQISTRRSKLLPALIKKEARAYFSSGIYVANTILGPILAVIGSACVLIIGADKIGSALPVDIGMILPFAISAIICMMNTTSVSLSMEGKRAWIFKTLPISATQLFDAKVLLNLCIIAPAYVLSEVLLIIALRPSASELLWLIAVPACLSLFSTVFGMWVNTKTHSFDWEREEQVVKQSASAALGGLSGALVSVLCGAACALAPNGLLQVLRAAICISLLVGAFFARRSYTKQDLTNLGGASLV